MTDYFKKLVQGIETVDNDALKILIYEAMLKYANEYHVGYVCYDMDMYVALYKYAIEPGQRKHALDHMNNIIVDDSHQSHEELIENLREVVSLVDILDDEDKGMFNRICVQSLNFFDKKLKSVEDRAESDQANSSTGASVDWAREELREVANSIISTEMADLECYQEAIKALEK
jgi:hypothetical protein